MKRFFAFFILFGALGLQFAFAQDLTVPAGARKAREFGVKGDSMPVYEDLKKLVDDLDDIWAVYKNETRVCNRIIRDLSEAADNLASERITDRLLDELKNCSVLQVIHMITIHSIVVDVFRINNSPADALRLGWTSVQLHDAKKWERPVQNLLKNLEELQDKSPSEAYLKALLERIAKLRQLGLALKTPTLLFFIFGAGY